jgi:hypothetical protein
MAVRTIGETPVQRFKPTSGRFVGTAGIAVALVLIASVAVTEQNQRGLQICLGLAIVVVLIWMTLLRPGVTAFTQTLILRNLASDFEVPLAAVDAVVVRHALNVWVGERRYVSPAIGRTSRSMLKKRKPGAASGLGTEVNESGQLFGQSSQIGSGADYATFVEQRIEFLARDARRTATGEPAPVRRRWAVLEIAVVAVLALMLLASFLF